MVKSKLARLPDEQRCQFLIGPTSSWFVPNTSDVWSKPCTRDYKSCSESQDDLMECDRDHNLDGKSNLSYFIYGCLGCICYGEIYQQADDKRGNLTQQIKPFSPIAAMTNRLIDIKEDNSRVICVRFSKQSNIPLAMCLTESGSLIIHNCLSTSNIVHFRKSELLKDDSEPSCGPTNKRAKMDITQQISSLVWPKTGHCLLGVSLRKEKTNNLLWLNLGNNLDSNVPLDKHSVMQSIEKVDIDQNHSPSPICLMESAIINYSGSERCLIAIATDDGLITVVCLDLEDRSAKAHKIIKLERHDDQICSMSFNVETTKKFPLGLLASVSRTGLTLIWDLEREFYFAYYSPETPRNVTKINWYTLTFVPASWSKQLNLIVSNQESGLTVLELPKNTNTNTRLREKSKRLQGDSDPNIRHRALIFSVIYNEPTKTIMTTSLDGNHILWSIEKPRTNDQASSIITRPRYLLPSLPNNARTHMLRHSPIRQDFMAIALGKAGIRFFKVGKHPNQRRFDMDQSCYSIAKKIAKASVSPTSVAWHPDNEYRLAIGTIEGRVFRADLSSRNISLLIEGEYRPIKLPTDTAASANDDGDLFGIDYRPLARGDDISGAEEAVKSSSKCDGIYSLCWGPNPISPDDRSKQAIYAVGSISHRLFIYCSPKENSDKMSDYLVEFGDKSLPEAKDLCSEISWKTSLDLMALGTVDGRIFIATYLEESHCDRSQNKLFKKLAVIEGPFQSAYIQCLAWHPTSRPDDPSYYYLAASSSESSAFIFNMKENILVADVNARLKIERKDSINYMDPSSNVLTSYMCKLDAHSKSISDISWSPHELNELATTSFDRHCYVWSLSRSEEGQGCSVRIRAKFAARDRLFTLDWSLIDSDLIYTSGQDSTIWAWRPSENAAKNSG